MTTSPLETIGKERFFKRVHLDQIDTVVSMLRQLLYIISQNSHQKIHFHK